MSKLPAFEVLASATGWVASEDRDSGVEMRADHYGLRCWTPVMTTYYSEQLAQIYICEIVRLHGVPVSIIFDRGTEFTS